MITLERILCPTDLSEDAERTLRYAVALARASGAKLFICHRPNSQADEAEVLQQIKELVATGETAPSPTGDHAAPVAWESFLLDGLDLGTIITRAAQVRRADLILMRSRRRPFAAALLGSTAEAVARLAPCPVLVMHADEREWIESASGAISLRRVLVAHDFSHYSQLALQYALNLVQFYQADLHLLHVLPPPIVEAPEIAWVGDKTNTPYHQAARRLHEAVSGEVHLWSNVKHAVQYGQPYAEILSYAETNEIDLISMGAHGDRKSVV